MCATGKLEYNPSLFQPRALSSTSSVSLGLSFLMFSLSSLDIHQETWKAGNVVTLLKSLCNSDSEAILSGIRKQSLLDTVLSGPQMFLYSCFIQRTQQ